MQLSPSGPIKVLVIHGPNLNLLGMREPDVYGSVTFYELNELIVRKESVSDVKFVLSKVTTKVS